MSLLRPDFALDQTGRVSVDPRKGEARDLALADLAREASLLALAAARDVALAGPGVSTAALATATLAAETERVARRIEAAIDAMRRQAPADGPNDAQIAAATAALAAARAIGRHCADNADGTRVAAEGFASAAAALETRPRRQDAPTAVAGTSKSH